MINENQLLSYLIDSVKKTGNHYWCNKLENFHNGHFHVAVMVEPYLSKILDGEKTIESRLSKKKTIPWDHVNMGDIIILKKSGGKFCAVFEAGEIVSQEITSTAQIENLKTEYNDRLCIEDEWWSKKADTKYATLIFITHLLMFDPFELTFKNRQAWIQLQNTQIKDIENIHLIPQKEVNYPFAIYCLSGKIGSGKTTIGKLWAQKVNGVHCSVSDFLKAQLMKEGVNEPSREQLQELGESYIKKGYVSFVNQVLNYIGEYDKQNVVIDGVRHIKFLNSLKMICYPIPVYEIVLDANEKTLIEHINNRGAESFNSTCIAEGNIDHLLLAADYIINVNNKNVETVLQELEYSLSKIKRKTEVSDENLCLGELREYIDFFNEIRGWKQYHNARDLISSINLEASELLEIFQWAGRNIEPDNKKMARIKEELADVLIYSVCLANACGIDMTQIIIEKLINNNQRYPVK